MDKNSENQLNGGGGSSSGARKINVSYRDAEQEFNKVDRTLEDIVNEELDEDNVQSNADEENFEEPVEAPEEKLEEIEPEVVEDDDSYEQEDESEWEANEAPVREIRDSEGLDKKPIKAGKKSGRGAIIFLLILMILFVVGFVVYYLLSMQIIKNDIFAGNTTKCETPAAPVDKKEAVEIVGEDEKVVGVVEAIRKEIENNHGQTAKLINTYNQTFPVHKINEDGMLFALNKSFGLYYDFNGDEWMEIAPQLNNDVVSALSELGFTEYAEGGFGMKYYSNDSGIICGPIEPGAGSPWAVACGSENWISEENEELAILLAEAYKNKQNLSLRNLMVDAGNISTSGKNGDYEAVIGQGDGAAQIFYRKSGGEWKYAFGAQSEPSCSIFDAEMKEALSGWTGVSSDNNVSITCFDEEVGESVEL